MMHIRQRNSSTRLELGGNRRLSFYAAVFSEPTTVYDFKPGERERSQFSELVRPGAFALSLKTPSEIVANIDHDDARTFARRSTGDLVLQEDAHGLFASCYLPETKLADQLMKDIERGAVSGASFRSRIVADGDQWVDGVCHVVTAPLVDVCVTGTPAYLSTSVRLRTEKYLDLFRRLRILKLKA